MNVNGIVVYGVGDVPNGPDEYGEVPVPTVVELLGTVTFGPCCLLGVAVTVMVVMLPWRGAEEALPVTDVPCAEDEPEPVTGELGVDEAGVLPVGDVPMLIVLFRVAAIVLVKVSVDFVCPLAHGAEELPGAVTGDDSEALGGPLPPLDDEATLLTVTV